MTKSFFNLDKITDYVTSDKTNIFIDFPLKVMTLLFSVFSVFGFLIIYLYFNEKGIEREAFSYIYSFQYLFFIAMFLILFSVLVFITFNCTFIFYKIMNGNKYINCTNSVFKAKCNFLLFFSFFLFWLILYFKIDSIKYYYIIMVVLFPTLYLVAVRNIIIYNDKFIFCLLFIACYCVTIISQIQIFILILSAVEKYSGKIYYSYLILLFVFVLNVIFYYKIDRLNIRYKIIISIIFIFFLSLFLIHIPNKIINLVGLGDYKSTYIITTDEVNIYEGLKPNIPSSWTDKKYKKLTKFVDVYVVANLPKKIIVSSDEKDHIMYSIPKSSILSEVFGVQPNDKS